MSRRSIYDALLASGLADKQIERERLRGEREAGNARQWSSTLTGLAELGIRGYSDADARDRAGKADAATAKADAATAKITAEDRARRMKLEDSKESREQAEREGKESDRARAAKNDENRTKREEADRDFYIDREAARSNLEGFKQQDDRASNAERIKVESEKIADLKKARRASGGTKPVDPVKVDPVKAERAALRQALEDRALAAKLAQLEGGGAPGAKAAASKLQSGRLLDLADNSYKSFQTATGGDAGGRIVGPLRDALTGYVPGMEESARTKSRSADEAVNAMVFSILGRTDAPADQETKRLAPLFLNSTDTPDEREAKVANLRIMIGEGVRETGKPTKALEKMGGDDLAAMSDEELRAYLGDG